MKLQFALVEMEGVPFGLVVVDQAILDDPARSQDQLRHLEGRVFRDLPVVMVGGDYARAPRFHGRPDLTSVMRDVEIDKIEWTWVDLPETLPSVN